MVDSATFLSVADTFRKPKRDEYRHYFNGANYLLSYLGAAKASKAGDGELAKRLITQYDMAIERLKSAAAVEATPVYRDGRLAELRLRVKNLRAGHNLPTSLTNVRQMWLEVSARDERGALLFTTGAVQADGSLPDDARVFNSAGMGKDMHFALDPWVITSFSRHDTIPARGFREVFYGVGAPAGVKAITFEVKLRYRQADQQVAEALLAAVPKSIDLKADYGLEQVPRLPIIDMVVLTTTAAVSK